MDKENHHITVFEHESIRFDKGDKRISENQFKALEKHFGDGVPYYGLRYNGVQFNEYVGVIQIGKTIIEVLPKADKHDTNENNWRKILIGMLKAVGSFDIKSTSDSHLKIKPNTILDLYFEMFIMEVEYLLHSGLIKQYRMKEGNVAALKGCLQFSKQIQRNLTHQERFYVKHSTYDVTHQLHFIIYKTICLLHQINTNVNLQSRIGALLLHFPEMPKIKTTESTFTKLVFTRKNKSYKKAIEIAKVLLLKYHPDLSKGRNHVLALMFDMNKLWEQFVYVSLKKNNETDAIFSAQSKKFFWQPNVGNRSKIIPDIWIKKNNENYILDTKWKNLNGNNPSPDDLRQMYVYHEYYNAKRVALVYPGEKYSKSIGNYLSPNDEKAKLDKECGIILLEVPKESIDNLSLIKTWQNTIKRDFNNWMVVKVNEEFN